MYQTPPSHINNHTKLPDYHPLVQWCCANCPRNVKATNPLGETETKYTEWQLMLFSEKVPDQYHVFPMFTEGYEYVGTVYDDFQAYQNAYYEARDLIDPHVQGMIAAVANQTYLEDK